MARLTERLPFPISSRLAAKVEALTARNGREIHYAIAGVPFRVATSNDLPEVRQTAPTQKDRQDTEPEPGEQTLSNWWLRSQSSWHEGAGSRFAESRGETLEGLRFWESSNVDVWTPGEITLLRRAATVTGATGTLSVAAIPESSTNSVVVGRAASVIKYNNLDSDNLSTTLYSAGGVNFTQVIATEEYWWAAGNDGKVYAGLLSGGAPSIWTLTGANTGKRTRIVWAKHRLWAINNNKVYVLDFNTPGATANAYSHPSSAYEYTDICDAPGGVLLAGFGDGTNALQHIGLTSADTAVPTIGGAVTTATLPSDEKPLRIASLAGSLICVATNRGVRVAAAQTSGELVYGPLMMERTTELSSAVRPALTAAGRWWWLSWGDEAKVWRIDSSTEIESGVFAHASDMEDGTSAFVDITCRGERPVVVTAAGGVTFRHATELCTSGYLQTGRIRYRTEEPKLYRSVTVNADPLVGSLDIDLLTQTDSELALLSYGVQGAGDIPEAVISTDLGTQRFVSVKLTLHRYETVKSTGPLIRGVQIRALPAVRPQRLYQLPLMCFDNERWTTGQRDGYDGFARDRYLSLRAAEDAGGLVIFQDYSFEKPVGELCKIEELKLVRSTGPDSAKFSGDWGGILVVTLRTLT